MNKTALGLTLASVLLLSAATAAQEPAERYVIPPAASKIKVDGLLDDEAGQKATVIKLPYEWMPGDNTPAPVETECLVTFDRAGLYIAFRCFDPKPGEIRAHLMDRDATDTLIQDDHINVIIDAFNDERRGFSSASIPWVSRPTPTSASSRAMKISPGTPSGTRPER
jgi:hypothetical protein